MVTISIAEIFFIVFFVFVVGTISGLAIAADLTNE